MKEYNRLPTSTARAAHRPIACFDVVNSNNVDEKVVKSFGEEWTEFHAFDEGELQRIAAEYFDILPGHVLTKDSYVMDAGCGTGRWSACLADRAGFIEAVDPSDAIFLADKMLARFDNVRLTRATIDSLPFDDGSFDFIMSIGVLHHIPDTAQAMRDCARKLKSGGYFYVYIYYALDNRSGLFKALFGVVDAIRRIVSAMPSRLKIATCNLLAVLLYMPPVLLGRFFRALGLKKLAARVPLSYYQGKSFYIIRNDALDRFGTRLEHRFTKAEIVAMMTDAGMKDIVVSPGQPYWHALGRKR